MNDKTQDPEGIWGYRQKRLPPGSNIYKRTIEGKTVALVGPAKYMQGTNYGKEIDSHEIVVRINRGKE